MLNKQPGWDDRLRRYIAATASIPFSYGTHDCALWVAGAVDTMCGTAIATMHMHRYTDKCSGVALLNQLPQHTLLGYAASLAGDAAPPGSVPLSGDIVWLPPSWFTASDGRELGTLGICRQWIWCPSLTCIARVAGDVAARAGMRVIRLG